MTSICEVCLELELNFAQLETGQLIKATQVFERLNLDLKVFYQVIHAIGIF